MLVLVFNLFLTLFVLVLCYLAVVAIVRSYRPLEKLERKTRPEDLVSPTTRGVTARRNKGPI